MKKNKIERVYHHYEDLEEYHHGMWRIVRGDERKRFIRLAGDLMKNPEEFRKAMRGALKSWPKSCASAFTGDGINHIAFLGHAGCCVATGSPEEATRAAWHTLSASEQDAANEDAAVVLAEWHSTYTADLPLFEFGRC